MNNMPSSLFASAMPGLGIIWLTLTMTFAIANESLAAPPKGRRVKSLKPLSVRSKPIVMPASPSGQLRTYVELHHQTEIESPKPVLTFACMISRYPLPPEFFMTPGKLVFKGDDLPHSFRMEDMIWWMR